MALGDTDTFTAADVNPASDSSMAEGGPISDVALVTASPGQKPSSSFITAQSPTPTRRSIPEPNLDRAYHTIDFLQRNPQWLANPYTTHAANAILATSSKMIEQSIQLERVNSQLDATRLRLNTDTRLVNHLNDGMAKLKDLAVVAAIREEINVNGPSPRAVSMLNTQLDLENPAGKPDSLTMADGSVLQGYRDKYGNFHQSQMQVSEAKDKAVLGHIEQRFKNQKELISDRYGYQENLMQDREFLKTLSLDTNTRLKRIDEDYKAASREVEKLRKDGVSEDDPKLLTAIGRQHLIAKRQSDVLDAMSPTTTPTTPTATQPSAPLPVPSVKSELKTGQRYNTSRGEATWDGEKFVQ